MRHNVVSEIVPSTQVLNAGVIPRTQSFEAEVESNTKTVEAKLSSSIIYAFSPSAKVQQLLNGNFLITITDKSGTTTAEIPCGGRIYSKSTHQWEQQQDFITEKNVLYVYTDYTTIQNVYIPAMKVGDGVSYLSDIPFLGGNNQGIDYNQIQNKPKINNVNLAGSLNDFQLQLQRRMDTLTPTQIERILYLKG